MNNQKNFYTISQLAKKLSVSSHTLRFYEKEGLLPSIQRDLSGNRLFSQADAEWLELLMCLKNTGMPLKEIKQFVEWLNYGDSTIEQRLALFQAQVEKVEQQIAELQRHLEILKYKRQFYQCAKELGSVQAVLDTQLQQEFAEQNILLPVSPFNINKE
ncbi:MerR family transcriptional regulator [Pasteurellaceae bacterium LFhippo2]|nr:MerR family transcriptional regulator [Pasteurellaceae bacterium LFhippo2]